jgi:DNA-binding CsgD family transcriptional regulator
MNSAAAAARAEVRFKQLCSLGLGKEAIAPALLKELHVIIPSCSGAVYMADEYGGLANLYTETSSPALQRLYFEHIYCQREPGYAFPDTIRTGSGIRDSEEIMASLGSDLNAWRRSDHYNLSFRPRRIDFALELVIREQRQGLGLALLYLHRGPGDRWFSPEEKRRLLRLERFLAHAFARSSKIHAPLTDSGRRGLLIADTEGRLLDFSAQGRRLLFLATHPRIAPTTDFSAVDTLPFPLIQVCKDLARVFSGDVSASAPVHSCRNIWGAFTFHAHWLEGPGSNSGLIGITISHREPFLIRLTHSIGHFRLSRRQTEVCLLMATGASIEQIAEQLGLSPHTVVAHSRTVYEQLGVHNRTALLNRLLAVVA